MSGTASVQAAGAGLQVVFGRGPVGCAAAKALLGRGLRVLMVSRSGARPEEALTGSGRLDTLAADALDPDAVKAASRGATHLYHCMNVPYQHWERTLAALQGSLAAAAEAQGAVLAVAENLYSYSRGVPVIDETTAEEAPTRKGRLRKRLHESLVAEATATGLRWVAVRASDYYGPGANEQSVFGTGRFLDPLLGGRRPALLGKLDVPHSYTYSEDYGRALALAALTPLALGKAWIVPNDRARTTREVAEMFAAAAGTSVKFGTIPRAAVPALGLFDPMIREVGEMLYQKEEPYVVDGSLFRDSFGFEPTTLEQGIADTIEWYRSRCD